MGYMRREIGHPARWKNIKHLAQNFIPVWNHILGHAWYSKHQAMRSNLRCQIISMNPQDGPFVCVCERGQVQDTVKVGSVLIDVETGDSSAPTPTPPKPEPTPAAAPAPAAASGGGVQQFKLVTRPKSLEILAVQQLRDLILRCDRVRLFALHSPRLTLAKALQRFS